ncbi:MAG: thiamine pyrophosphokinase [Lachnospiraceae bacterium]|nr:thiamine pyrophosphokinase [Lachnospiraceae bacterium]
MKKCLMVAGGAVSAPLLGKIFREEEFAYVFAVDRGLEALDACGIRATHLVGDFDSVAPDILKKYLTGQETAENGSDREAVEKACAASEKSVGVADMRRSNDCCADGKALAVERLIPEKDDTDTEHAMRRAVALDPDEIVLAGGFGTRFDHVLANVHTLIIPLCKGIPACMVDETNRVRLLGAGCQTETHRKSVPGGSRKEECSGISEAVHGVDEESVNEGTHDNTGRKLNASVADAQLRIKISDAWGNYVSLLPLTTEVSGITLEGFKYTLTDGSFRVGETVSLGVSNELTAEEGIIRIKNGILAVIESSDDGRI